MTRASAHLQGPRRAAAAVTGAIYRVWLAYGPRPAGIRRRRLLELLKPQPGEQLLEIGPGAGYYSVPVARRIQPHGRLVLVDVDQAMLAATMRRLRRRGLARFSEAHWADAASLPSRRSGQSLAMGSAALELVAASVARQPLAVAVLIDQHHRPEVRLHLVQAARPHHLTHAGQSQARIGPRSDRP
jgi:predicted methyltransferase